MLRATEFTREGKARILADCGAVISNAKERYPDACHHSIPAGGLLKQVVWDRLGEAIKTKAHLSKAQAEADNDLHNYRCGDFCDAMAKQAVVRFPREMEVGEEKW